MKILDKYLLKTFLITFTTVFVILFFIFILQTVWLFIAELAGKDLDFILIVKFLAYKMPSIVPMVLPLSVLLASIMTFGGLAENYEFAAMKSSGISLQRAMKSQTAFILVLTVIAFAFANNVIPYAEYKFINFRRNIAQVKPAMAIAEGQFSEIGNYSIKVDKKSGKKGNLLTGVIIHLKSSSGEGNKTVIKAKRGELISNESSNTLKLVLYDGFYYEDVIPTKFEDREKMPFAKASFKKDVINIDLSKLNTNMETGEIANTNTMLSVSQLRYTLDSLNTNYKKDVKAYSENSYQRLSLPPSTRNQTNIVSKIPINNDLDIMNKLDNNKKLEILRVATSNIENSSFAMEYYKIDLDLKQRNINGHLIALYDKFVIAFSCILMFFIGAPLGAIIRKGGLGLPIVFAVTIFIIFHFINTFGKKVAQENGMPPFLGTWMSTIVLAPLAVFLTYRATKDLGGMISFDYFNDLIKKIFPSEDPTKLVEQPLINLGNYKVIEDEEWEHLNQHDTANLIQVVKNAKQLNYTDDYRSKALIILDSRGITQENLLQNNNLYNTDFERIDLFSQMYYQYAKIAFVSNIILIIIANALKNFVSTGLIIAGLVVVILFFYSLFTAQKKLEQIQTISGKQIEPGLLVTMVVGFPFYLFLYFYNNKVLKKILS